MLPFFPLDGGSVLKGLVSHEMSLKLNQLDKFGAFLILGIFLLDRFAGTGIFAAMFKGPINFLVELFAGSAFPSHGLDHRRARHIPGFRQSALRPRLLGSGDPGALLCCQERTILRPYTPSPEGV